MSRIRQALMIGLMLIGFGNAAGQAKNVPDEEAVWILANQSAVQEMVYRYLESPMTVAFREINSYDGRKVVDILVYSADSAAQNKSGDSAAPLSITQLKKVYTSDTGSKRVIAFTAFSKRLTPYENQFSDPDKAFTECREVLFFRVDLATKECRELQTAFDLSAPFFFSQVHIAALSEFLPPFGSRR